MLFVLEMLLKPYEVNWQLVLAITCHSPKSWHADVLQSQHEARGDRELMTYECEDGCTMNTPTFRLQWLKAASAAEKGGQMFNKFNNIPSGSLHHSDNVNV